MFVEISKLQKFKLMICKPYLDQTGTLVNREDPDEIQHDAAFQRGLHCLLRQN